VEAKLSASNLPGAAIYVVVDNYNALLTAYEKMGIQSAHE
jgi:hypothetical protein